MTNNDYLPRVLGFCLCVGLAFGLAAHARDLGFRYQGGKCVNAQGAEGLNPGFIGQCADLNHVTIYRFDFTDIDLSGAHFESADLQDSVMKDANISGAVFINANLAGVSLEGAIAHGTNFAQASMINTHFAGADFAEDDFSGADLSGALLSYVHFGGSKFQGTKFIGATMDHIELQKANLAGADFSGINLKGGKFDFAILDQAKFLGADLTGASFIGAHGSQADFRNAIMRQSNLSETRVSGAKFRSAQLDGADFTKADVTGADFRSAKMAGVKAQGTNWSQALYSNRTVLPFASDVAQKQGMVLSKGERLLIIWDTDSANVPEYLSLKAAIDQAGLEAVLSTQNHRDFNGKLDLSDFTAIFHTTAVDYQADMPAAGQAAILDFVRKGGTYIATQFSSFMVKNGKLVGLRDLLLLDYVTNNIGEYQYNFSAADAGHPLLTGLRSGGTVNCEHAQMALRSEVSADSKILVTDASGNPMVTVRNVGQGKTVNFAWALRSFNQTNCMGLPEPQQLVLNALLW